MENDDEPQLTLSKWPFYLGDALLVATALAIAILGEWNLTNWQVLSCVLAVVMGAALLCLPFLFEHWLRNQEQREDRNAQLRVLERKIDEVTEAAIQLREETEVQRARSDRLETANEAIAEMVDQKLVGIEEAKAATGDTDFAPKAETEALGESLKILEDRVGQLAGALTQAEAKLGALEASAAEARAKPERKERAPRQPKKPEPRLLHRAIKDESASKSEAVSRIIRSKSKEAPPPPEPEAKEPPQEPEPEATTEPAAEPEVANDTANEAPPESKNAPPPPEPKAPPPPADEIDLEAEVPAMDASDMLFDELPESGARKKRTKKTDTVLRANILIGIGNKPFVRGEGGGLSWETGVPMEFESIGSWRWLAPTDADGSIEFQIYRNDEDPDATGRHRIEPGEQLEIEPKF